MQLNRIQVDRHYSKIRQAALEAAQRYCDHSGIVLTEITEQAIKETERWVLSNIRQYHWNWASEVRRYRRSYPKRFEISLWLNHKLIGISIGRPTYNATGLRLDVVEASPRDLGPRPQVFDTILLAYEVYARMLNASHIRIMNPVNKEVRSYYESFGYTYMSRGDYLVRGIL